MVMSNTLISKQLKLYFIMGSVNTNDADPLQVLEEALRGGVTLFQLREKGPESLTGEKKRAFAVACQTLCREYGVPFIVNDDVELALDIDADGVHIGQDDGNALAVRAQLGPDKTLGISAHNEEEVQAAVQAGADYIGMGPVYATTTKKDAQAVAGTKIIVEARNLYPDLPIVGIGGIKLINAKPVLEAGADGVAVISAIAAASNPFQATQDFLNKLS